MISKFNQVVFLGILLSISLQSNLAIAQACSPSYPCGPAQPYPYPFPGDVFNSYSCSGNDFNYNDAGRYLAYGQQSVILGQGGLYSRIRLCNNLGCGSWTNGDVVINPNFNEYRVYGTAGKLFSNSNYPFFNYGVEIYAQGAPQTQLTCATNSNSTLSLFSSAKVKNYQYNFETFFNQLTLSGGMKSNCSWYKTSAKSIVQPSSQSNGYWTEADIVYFSKY